MAVEQNGVADRINPQLKEQRSAAFLTAESLKTQSVVRALLDSFIDTERILDAIHKIVKVYQPGSPMKKWHDFVRCRSASADLSHRSWYQTV